MKLAARAVALAAMAGTLCAASVLADESAKAPTVSSSSAMRVVVDPDTGELRAPTHEELRALIEAEQAARAAERSARTRSAAATAPEVLPETKTVERHANGMISIKLSQESLSVVKVETDEHGKARLVHADEPSSATPAEEK